MSKTRQLRSRPRHLALILRDRLLALHSDERGAVSVLAILILMCLVAALGMVWNTAEESVRREQIQTAADAAAYDSSTWVARTLNAVDAQNMVISQDASEETIWRAVPPTDQALRARLEQELVLAQQMKQNHQLQNLYDDLARQLTNIETERQFVISALADLKAAGIANYGDADEAARYANLYRQSESVREWVWNTYVQGNQPRSGDFRAPPRPGPPGPNGQGLVGILQSLPPPPNEDAVLDFIINYINNTEIPIVRAFEQKTAPGTAQPIPSIVAAHQYQVYHDELALTQSLSAVIEQQRAAVAAQYRTDITLATLNRTPGESGPAQVSAPLVPASQAIPVTGYVDTIRSAYPTQARAAGLPIVFDIDPVNVHTNEAMIWHPDVPVAIPDQWRAQYPTLAASYTLSANFPEGWGHIWAMPLEHYVHQRVNNDMQEILADFMRPLDQSRRPTLAQAIRTMLAIPTIQIANLPFQLPDDQAEPNIPPLQPGEPVPPPRFDQITVLPRITAPVNADATYRAQLVLYNQHGGAYTGAVRRLARSIMNYNNLERYRAFIDPFAALAWNTNVNDQCVAVLEALGQKKQFLVLATYGLRPIPDWAKSGMFDNATIAIEDHLMSVSVRPIVDAIMRALLQQDPNGVRNVALDPAYIDYLASNAYSNQAVTQAMTLLRATAHTVALRLAAEWVNRPWPYEISPPNQPVPPFHGIGPDDRKLYYTVIAAARQTDATAPHVLLPRWFGSDKSKLIAYAQAESFNWMEFNDSYGGSERFDEVVYIPEVTYRTGANTSFNGFVGSPRGWRVDSIGGWNNRLSLSDALYDALQTNTELQQYMSDAGVSNPDSGALDEINLH